jgi:hypothetical protein
VIARTASLPRLHTLVLAQNPLLEPNDLAILLESPLACRLRDLDLSSCRMSAGVADVLAQSPVVAGLERLDLRRNDFGEEGLAALARSPYLRGVPVIRLSGNPWGFSEANRRLLEERFGRSWYYHEEDEEVPEDDEPF